MNPRPRIMFLLEPVGVSLMEALLPRNQKEPGRVEEQPMEISVCGGVPAWCSASPRSQAPLRRAQCPEAGVRKRLKRMQSGQRSPLRPQPLRSRSSLKSPLRERKEAPEPASRLKVRGGRVRPRSASLEHASSPALGRPAAAPGCPIPVRLDWGAHPPLSCVCLCLRVVSRSAHLVQGSALVLGGRKTRGLWPWLRKDGRLWGDSQGWRQGVFTGLT